MEYLGNTDLLKLPKTAFLCSQKCPAEVVLKSYDWAKQQRAEGNCIVCGNHSQIEKDVFEILLKGKQPLILVLARGMKKALTSDFRHAIAQNRLLIIAPYTIETKRVTEKTAACRNKVMIELANDICVGNISNGGNLEEQLKLTNKKITKISDFKH